MKITRKRLYDAVFFIYLFIVIFCLTLRYKVIGEPSIRPLQLPGFMLLVGGMYLLAILFFNKYSKYAQTRFSINSFIIFLFTFFNLYILATMIQGTGIYTIKTALLGFILNVSFFFLLILFVLIRDISANDLSVLLAKFFVYTAVIFSVVAMLMYFDIVNLTIGSFKLATSPSYPNRIHGHFGDPSSLGGMAGLGIVCAAYLLTLAKQKRYFLAILFLIIAVIMSGSRNAVVSMIVSLSLFFMLTYSHRRMVLLLSILMGIGIGGVLIFHGFETEITKYIDTAFRLGASVRVGIWINAIQSFLDGSIVNILFGHGYEYFRQNYGASFNIFLKFAVDYGLVFVLFFLILIIYMFGLVFRTLNKRSKESSALFGIVVLTYSLVFAMFLDTILPIYFHIMNFAFICSMVVISRMRFFSRRVLSKGALCMRI